MSETPDKLTINPKEFTLLIVDDEVDLREVLCFQFQREGFTVYEAGNGAEAFEIVKAHKIDLVISDIQMPGGNGVDLLSNIRQYDDEVPVVLFVTGFTDITVDDAFKKGAEAVFSKPFDQKVLLKTVCEALSLKEERSRIKGWRSETALPVEVKLPGSETPVSGKVSNVGRSGIFVVLDKNLPKITETVGFKIHFKGEKSVLIEGQGTVRWVRATQQGDRLPGFGMEFHGLSELTKSKIIELINFLKTNSEQAV